MTLVGRTVNAMREVWATAAATSEAHAKSVLVSILMFVILFVLENQM